MHTKRVRHAGCPPRSPLFLGAEILNAEQVAPRATPGPCQISELQSATTRHITCGPRLSRLVEVQVEVEAVHSYRPRAPRSRSRRVVPLHCSYSFAWHPSTRRLSASGFTSLCPCTRVWSWCTPAPLCVSPSSQLRLPAVVPSFSRPLVPTPTHEQDDDLIVGLRVPIVSTSGDAD